MSRDAVKVARSSVLTLLGPMFSAARRSDLCFYSPDQMRWFSPDELQAEQSQGAYIWGPEHWQLRESFKRPAA